MRLVIMTLIAAFPALGKEAPPRTKTVTPTKSQETEIAPQKPVVIRMATAVNSRSAFERRRSSDDTAPSAPSIPKLSATTQSFARVPGANPAAHYAFLGLQPTSFTPYDRFLDNVWPVLRHLDNDEVSMVRVMRLMETGHKFSYRFTDPYRPQSPEFTATRRSGDCKSKALWLCAALGDPNALWVVGKKSRRSEENHAWVYWRSEGRWYVLDCTENSRPVQADTIPRDRYIPYYSFGKVGAFRHMATRIQLVSTTQATLTIASRK